MEAALIIDDDPFIRETLRAALSRRHFRVLDAANGPDAIEIVREIGPKLVIVDMIMPKMDGLEVIAAIRDVRPQTVIVAMTGAGRAGDLGLLDMAKQVGADLMLSKPFNFKDLFARLERQFAIR